MNSVVRVRELTDKQVRQLTQKYDPRGVNLGGAHDASAAIAEDMVDNLIGHSREQGGRRFLLEWEGDKIPTGARVLGYEITWTQNGLVRATSNELEEYWKCDHDYVGEVNGKYVGLKDIGTYDRLVEFGGKNHRQQKMVIYLYPQGPKKKRRNATRRALRKLST